MIKEEGEKDSKNKLNLLKNSRTVRWPLGRLHGPGRKTGGSQKNWACGHKTHGKKALRALTIADSEKVAHRLCRRLLAITSGPEHPKGRLRRSGSANRSPVPTAWFPPRRQRGTWERGNSGHGPAALWPAAGSGNPVEFGSRSLVSSGSGYSELGTHNSSSSKNCTATISILC